MRLKYLLAGAALASCMAAGAASASVVTVHVLGAEGDSGFVGNLFADSFPDSKYMVASDGENAFNPFGWDGGDTSDGLNFNDVGHVWTQAEDSHWTFVSGQTWVLPASTSCGTENEPVCEPVGHFVSSDAWLGSVLGTYLIYDGGEGSALSDKIVLTNTAGGADLKFYSDPTLGVPEPATWAMMLTGFFGLGAVVRGQRKTAVAA